MGHYLQYYRHVYRVFSLVSVIFGLVVYAAPSKAGTNYLKIGAAEAGGENYAVAASVAQRLSHDRVGQKNRPSKMIGLIVPVPDAAERLDKMARGELDAVVLSSVEIFMLSNQLGHGTRAKSPPLFGLRSLALLQRSPLHIIVNATAKHRPNRSMDLRGRNFITLGRNASETEFLEQVFASYRTKTGSGKTNFPKSPTLNLPPKNLTATEPATDSAAINQDRLDPSFEITAEQLRALQKIPALANAKPGLAENAAKLNFGTAKARNIDAEIDQIFADLAAEKWDAVLMLGIDPIPYLVKASLHYPLALVPLEQLPSNRARFAKSVMPMATQYDAYNGISSTNSLAIKYELLVPSRMKNGAVEQIMQSLWSESQTKPSMPVEVNAQNKTNKLPILPRVQAQLGVSFPLHPAAARYYSALKMGH